jgi:receptor protein-tyrosine kinase
MARNTIERAARRLTEPGDAPWQPQDAEPQAPHELAESAPRPEPFVATAAVHPHNLPADDGRAARGAGTTDATTPAASRRVEIDLARLALAGMMSPTAPRTRIADELRLIKRPLLHNAQGKSATPVRDANLIMVTSAVPHEGKSFLAINLALSIAAEMDHTVLLVDGDVPASTVLQRLGLPPAKGIMDLLTDDALDLSDVLLETNIERLSLLPAGTPHPHATELLASAAMGTLVSDLARRYSNRIVVFDSPPLLAAPEPRVLATHMGQIVFVVEADRTRRSLVQEALATVEACPVVMTVLNKASRSGAGGYGYGYGYGHGSRK